MLALILACGPSAPAGPDSDVTPEPATITEPTNEPSDTNDFLPPLPTLTQLERQYPFQDLTR